MPRLVSIDGVIHGPEEATVSVYDRGFLYGDSVFETVRTYGGVPFALEEHVSRLERSADRVGIVMPVGSKVIASETQAVVDKAGNSESYIRLMLTRGSGPVGLDPALAVAPLRLVLVEPLKPLPAELYEIGVDVVFVRTARASDAAHGAKVGNYLASLLALSEARQRGAHEALVVGQDGDVIEGTTSNVFVVRAGVLHTPPEEAGILLGITRHYVIRIARELGLVVQEERLTPAQVASADEVFISSSIREVLPVVRCEGVPIGKAELRGRVGPVARRLLAEFRARVV